MPDATWKKAEREIAARLGSHREGPTGAADILTDEFSVEVKHRKTLPKWLHQAMEQSEGHTPPGKKALVVLHETGQRYDDCYVVVRLSDFTELLKGESK